jgi:uncharacterized membrane protein
MVDGVAEAEAPRGPPVTVTVTASEETQPADEVAVRVKVCVAARLSVVVVSSVGLVTRFAGAQL